MKCVVIVGGAGQFGRRIAERLARAKDFKIVIAGRNLDRARAAAGELLSCASASVTAAQINSQTVTSGELSKLSPDMIINASGPFQSNGYALVEASIDAGSHYIDLADARQFVVEISQYDQRAKDAGVLVVSGASTVPGLSSVVVGKLSEDLDSVESIDICLSPGNHFDPGLATTRSVLMGLGQPIPTRRDGKEIKVFGWQDLSRRRLGRLGTRWFANVDVPDLTLFPQHYPGVASVTFQAGTELSIQHLGLWALSWLARVGLLRHPDHFAELLLWLKSVTRGFGSECGGMQVTVRGRKSNGQQIEKCWTLVARDSHGPYVPTFASTILAKSLANGSLQTRGALPCFELFPYDAISREIGDLSITCTIDQAMR